jgi:hypothetical protein
MSGIRKIDPADIDILKHIYGVISNTENTNFKELSWETFLECRGNIYIYVDGSNGRGCEIINAVIACRRAHMEEIDVEELSFYCKPYHVIYSIECLYMTDSDEPNKISDIVCQLVDAECKDKNDGFVCLRVYSAENKSHRYVSRLLTYGFRFADYSKNVWTFLKSPTMNK